MYYETNLKNYKKISQGDIMSKENVSQLPNPAIFSQISRSSTTNANKPDINSSLRMINQLKTIDSMSDAQLNELLALIEKM